MVDNALKNKAPDIVAEAMSMCDDPLAYFGEFYENMDSTPREKLDALQLEGLKYRFDTLKEGIQMVQRLAKGQGIEKIESLNDIVPLLFEHTMYKSYPPVLLEKQRFKEINKFLNKLTTVDISDVDVSSCQSIDDWVEVMDRETDMRVTHTSGTSGTMSFLPLGPHELNDNLRVQVAKFKADLTQEYYCLFPFYRSGASAHLRQNDSVVNIVTGEERFIAAFPGRMSADVLYLAARLKAAEARGKEDDVEISPGLRERVRKFQKFQAEMPDYIENFFERCVTEFKGKHVWLAGTWNILHSLARRGLAKKIEGVFHPDSILLTGGGAKGMVQPAGWQEDIRRFFGVTEVHEAYGMAELMGPNFKCDHGNFHFSPWIIPFLLDPDTSDVLPRSGIVTGRGAFYNLHASTRWGGIISGDKLTINWDEPCGCGRLSYYMAGDIQRYSDLQGGDDRISCAATESAHKQAMDFLTEIN